MNTTANVTLVQVSSVVLSYFKLRNELVHTNQFWDTVCKDQGVTRRWSRLQSFTTILFANNFF